MSEETTVIKKEEETVTIPPAGASTETSDAEDRLAQLEVEKANYKMAFLKEKNKNKQISNVNDEDETEDERIERIIAEKLAQSKIMQIDAEKEAIYQKAIKENKEMKLAQINKTTTPPAVIGSHSESTPVTDTIVTPEQSAAFKQKGWSDKDIERYKKNLNRYSGR